MKKQFENFLKERNDEIDHLSYQLAVTLLKQNPSDDDDVVLPWNMEIIGAINEAVLAILKERNKHGCWPYYENEIPCYMTNTCEVRGCLFKSGM